MLHFGMSTQMPMPGVLSYAEIESYMKTYQLKTAYDEEAGVKYMAWNQDQWVSYDDQETLQRKVDFANGQG
jgi:chitinase